MSSKHRDNSVLGSILTQLHRELRDQTNESTSRSELIAEANSLFRARTLSPRTVEKWFNGDVAHPRDWCGLLMLLAALKADRGSANQALLAAGLSAIGEIIPETDQEEEVLEYWKSNKQETTSPNTVIKPIFELPPQSRPYGFHQNAHFVGREDVLIEMFEQLQTQRGIFITGMSGVGKTQLAIEFAYRYAKYFSGGVFFINCADPKTVDAEIAACGGIQAMRLSPHYEEWQIKEQAAAVKERWKDSIPRLLIFDNIEASEEINVEQWLVDDLVPQSGASRVVVTTTKDTWALPLLFHQIRLNVLERDESARMLRTEAPWLTDAPATQIAEKLGDLPLALYGAGCYLRQYRFSVSPESYIRMLDEAGALASDRQYRPIPSPTRHELSVERTFSLNFQKLNPEDTVDRLAMQLLACLTYLAPGEPVPLSLLNIYFSLEVFNSSGFKIEDALGRLSDLGLVQTALDTVTVHRLLLRFLHMRLERPQYLYTAMTDAILVIDNSHSDIDARWLSHVHYLSSELINDEKTLNSARLVSIFGAFMVSVRDIQNARTLFEWALAVQKNSNQTDPLQLAYTYHQAGISYGLAGELDVAGKYYEAALAIRRKNSQVNDRDLATTLNNLGYTRIRHGDLATARQYLAECLEIRQKLDIGIGVVKNNLGLLLFLETTPGDRDGLSSALTYLQQGLDFKLNNPRGANSLSMALSYARIGIVQYAMGDTELGKQSLDRAVAHLKAAFPANSIGPGLELYNFALLLKTNRRYDSACLCATRATALLAETTGIEITRYIQLVRLLVTELRCEDPR